MKLINVDHIIYMMLYKEEADIRYKWVPVKYVKPKLCGLNFWSKDREIKTGGYYTEFGIKIENLDKYMRDVLGSTHKLVKTDNLDEGPYGTIFKKSHIRIITCGGKYTHEHYEYYDSDQDALKSITDIKEKYKDKFIITI